MDAIREMDAWCKRRATALCYKAEKHILAGGSLEDPGYRMMVGEHRGYIAMRSYIHGSLANQDRGE